MSRFLGMISSTPTKSRRLQKRDSDELIIEDDDTPDFDFDFDFSKKKWDTFSIEPKPMTCGTPDNRSRRLKMERTGTGTSFRRNQGKLGLGRSSSKKREKRGSDSSRKRDSLRKRGSDIHKKRGSMRGSIKRKEKKITMDSLDLHRYKTGAVTRQKQELKNTDPTLGMECSPVPGKGLMIESVDLGKPIYHAGIRDGDMITHVQGMFCDSKENFFQVYKTMAPGDDLMLKITRDDVSMTLRVIVGAAGYSTEQIMKIRSISVTEHVSTKTQLQKIESAKKKLKLMKVSMGMMIKANPHDTSGLEVDEVDKNGAAGKAGIIRGDIMVEVKGKKISDTTTFFDVYQKLEPGEKITMKVMRDAKLVKLTVRVGANGYTLKEVKKIYNLAKCVDYETLKAQEAMSPPVYERTLKTLKEKSPSETLFGTGSTTTTTTTKTKTTMSSSPIVIEEETDFVDFGDTDISKVGKGLAVPVKKDDRFSFSNVARRD